MFSKNINLTPHCSLGAKLELMLLSWSWVFDPAPLPHKGLLGMLIALAFLTHSLAHMANGVVKHTRALTPPKRRVGNTQRYKGAQFCLV